MSADTNIDPHERAQSSVDQEMSQESRRAYSDAVQVGLNGNSPQPNAIRYDQEYLKDASIGNDLPKRPCSLHFHLNVTNFTVQSLLQDVKQCGISVSSVQCAQKVSQDAYVVTFKTPEDRDLFFQNSRYIARRPDAGTFVWIYDAPCELPDDAIRDRLSAYGQVQRVQRRTYTGYQVETGVRTTKMIIDRPVPSFLRFGRRLVRIFHVGQDATCRRCNSPGHVAKECREKICFNCEEHGHEAPDCVQPLRCSICKLPGHWAHKCKYSWARQRDAPVAERPGTSLRVETQDSQPSPAVSNDVGQPSSPQLFSGSSPSSNSGSSSASSTTQTSSQHTDDHKNDTDDDKDDGDDTDNDDDDKSPDEDSDDSMDDKGHGEDKDDGMDDKEDNDDSMDVSLISGITPTDSEEQMIMAAAAVSQENNELHESSTNKRRASPPKNRKSRSSKKKR